MGWASGSYLAEEIWQEICPNVPAEKWHELAKSIYDKFCDQDADDWDYECGRLWSLAYPKNWRAYICETSTDPEEILKELTDHAEILSHMGLALDDI